MRTFIAVELEPTQRRPLIQLLEEGLPAERDVRWCTAQQLHVTLKFLGELRADLLAPVRDAVAQVSRQIEPFPLRVRGFGCFPSQHSPRVLWCGVVDPAGGCRRWVELADPLLAAFGFEPEERAFTPHITLGRSRSPAGGRVFQRVLETVPPPETVEAVVRQVVIFESRLLPTGAQYRPVAAAPLGAGAT